MTRHSKGPRVRTRKLLRRHVREKTPITKYLQSFDNGEKVLIKIDPSSGSIPFPRFHGRVGTVEDKRGRAFIVNVKDGSLNKKLIVKSEHLRKA